MLPAVTGRIRKCQTDPQRFVFDKLPVIGVPMDLNDTTFSVVPDSNKGLISGLDQYGIFAVVFEKIASRQKFKRDPGKDPAVGRRRDLSAFDTFSVGIRGDQNESASFFHPVKNFFLQVFRRVFPCEPHTDQRIKRGLLESFMEHSSTVIGIEFLFIFTKSENLSGRKHFGFDTIAACKFNGLTAPEITVASEPDRFIPPVGRNKRTVIDDHIF